MAGSHYTRRPASRFTLDWMLVAVALIATAIVAGSLIRTGGDAGDRFGPTAIGTLTLMDADRLIAFEDYGFDAGGWAGRGVDDGDATLGSVLGPMSGEVLSRLFDMPDRTRRVVIAFDVIGMDGPVDMQISINGHDPDNVQTRAATRTRIRYWVMATNPGPFVSLALGSSDDSVWALDNLSVTAELPSQMD